MDLARLRPLLRPLIGNLNNRGTDEVLADLCIRLGMPAPEPAESKRKRLHASFDAVPDEFLPTVAQRFLEQFPPASALRNEIQELLWADRPGPPVPKKYRRSFARALSMDALFADLNAFDRLITSLFVVEEDLAATAFGMDTGSLRAEIDRHVYRNPGDWTPELLLERLGAYECSDRRFGLFVEGLASAEVHPDEAIQRRFVDLANEQLHACGVELRESGEQGGYPVFSLVPVGLFPAGRPKNLIFASSVKPDLRFRDAVNNDVEVVSNAEQVLIYDRQVGMDGLRWAELQAWWAERERLTSESDAKETLYRRLQQSLPASSPPQRFFFATFFRTFGAEVPRLPALLPEVWLHWDPKTVAERGASALARFRMDFLLLLPNGARVVVEIDGKQHYAEDNGAASPTKYAEMTAADRDLRLSGYEVYRFGGSELDGGVRATSIVGDFFRRLFKRHGVTAGS